MAPFIFRLGEPPPPGARVRVHRACRAVIPREESLLLVHTSDGDVKFPGGGMKPGERPEDTLRREVAEETGRAGLLPGKLLGTALQENRDRAVPKGWFRMESAYYLCTLEDDRTIPRQLDPYEARMDFTPLWLSPEEALAANRALPPAMRDSFLHWTSREILVLEWLLAHPETLLQPDNRPKEKETATERKPQ